MNMTTSEMIRPMMPMMSRIVPTTLMSMPTTSKVTAYFSTAPTAINTIDVPMPTRVRSLIGMLSIPAASGAYRDPSVTINR